MVTPIIAGPPQAAAEINQHSTGNPRAPAVHFKTRGKMPTGDLNDEDRQQLPSRKRDHDQRQYCRRQNIELADVV